MATSVDLGSVLDRAYKDKSLQEILNAPPSALAGVTEGAFRGLRRPDRRRTGWEQVLRASWSAGRIGQQALARLAAKLSCQSAYCVPLMISQTTTVTSRYLQWPFRSTALDSVRDYHR
jgi:hypothetical protein